MFRFFFAVYMIVTFAHPSFGITGYVFLDKNNNGLQDKNEEGIADVSVSDLFNVVKTNSDGFYQLTSLQRSKFISISLPSGFAAKNWWQKIESNKTSIDFPLTIFPTKTGFTFIHASDTHISDNSLDL